MQFFIDEAIHILICLLIAMAIVITFINPAWIFDLWNLLFN